MKKTRKINKKKMLLALFTMALAVAIFVFPAAAAISAPTVMGNLISLMCSMFKFVGIALFVWAIIQFILATKRSDADSKSDAIQTAMCGVALMAVASIVNNLGLGDAGLSGTISDDKLETATAPKPT